MTPPPITTACAWVFIRAAPATGPSAHLFRRYGAGAGEGVLSAAQAGVFATGGDFPKIAVVGLPT